MNIPWLSWQSSFCWCWEGGGWCADWVVLNGVWFTRPRFQFSLANFGICRCQSQRCSEARPNEPAPLPWPCLIPLTPSPLPSKSISTDIQAWFICCDALALSQDSPPRCVFPLVDERPQKQWPFTPDLFLLLLPNTFRKRCVCDVSGDVCLLGVKREIRPAQKSSPFLPRFPGKPACHSRMVLSAFISLHLISAESFQSLRFHLCNCFLGLCLHMFRSSWRITVVFQPYLTNMWALTGEFPLRSSSFWLLECSRQLLALWNSAKGSVESSAPPPEATLSVSAPAAAFYSADR